MVNDKMVNDKMVNGFMKKKEYIVPLCSVVKLEQSLMKYTGAASVPSQAGAPARRTRVF